MDRNDFLHRFCTTVIGLPEGDVVIPVYVREDQDWEGGSDLFYGFTGQGLLSEFSIDDPWVDYPKLGYINGAADTVFFERRPERQWRRGFTFSNVSGRHVYSRGLDLDTYIENPWLERIFNPRYPSVEECLDIVKEESEMSQAFSPSFMVYKANDKAILQYYQRNVGYFLDDALVLPQSLDFLAESIQYPVQFKGGY